MSEPLTRRALAADLRRIADLLDGEADPSGLDYTRVDDGEDPQPAAGRVPPSFGAVVSASAVPVPLLKLPMRDEQPRLDIEDYAHGGSPHEWRDEF